MTITPPEAAASRPLILLDVDGVLNPWYRPGPEWEVHEAIGHDMTYRVVLNPAHGPMLLELAHDTGSALVWATTWVELANREIGPRIGLPELPVIPVNVGREVPGVGHKTPQVAEYVAGRPFVWFDDDLTRSDTKFLKGHDGVGSFRIIQVGPRQGLNDRHLRQAAAWFASLSENGTPS
ncbi:HAD domain-containing protein [Nonomuraea basaltis]|uniref:HAD domain-containing protein n=1 Tax=Nonomuraea basaltis TaxID=2495887 RepID=UPI001980F90D|nr:HAD domain-containing protein [Nonomuraea basaltis]